MIQRVCPCSRDPGDFRRGIRGTSQTFRGQRIAIRQGQGRTRELGNNNGDVVFSASLIGQIDQGLTSGFEIGSFIDDARNFVGVHLARQPVAANHEGVQLAERHGVDFNIDVVMCAERLEDHVPVTVGFGFLFGDLPRVNQLLNERLVLGDAIDSALSNEMRATVTHLREVHVVAVRGDRRESGSQPPVSLIGLSVGVDDRIRFFDSQAESFGKGHPAVHFVGLQLEHAVSNGFNCNSRGDFPGQRPPHAVRNGEQSSVIALCVCQ